MRETITCVSVTRDRNQIRPGVAYWVTKTTGSAPGRALTITDGWGGHQFLNERPETPGVFQLGTLGYGSAVFEE
jgi:hypothetical protein